MGLLAASLWLYFAATTGNCATIETTVTGNSMQGILWNGQKITVYTLGCGEPQRYDHLLFTSEETPNAVVKQIWGMPGDMLRVDDGGKLYIDDVMAKTPFGRPYVLIGFSKKRLKKLEGKPLEGFILLGHPGGLDSARVGQVMSKSVLGYVKCNQPYAGDDPKG